jgi:hypothetical protein
MAVGAEALLGRVDMPGDQRIGAASMSDSVLNERQDGKDESWEEDDDEENEAQSNPMAVQAIKAALWMAIAWAGFHFWPSGESTGGNTQSASTQRIENCAASFREMVDGKWVCRKLTEEEAREDAAINAAAKEREAREHKSSERVTMSLEEMKAGAQAMINLETNYPWSSRIADKMARGESGNHCKSVLHAVSAYEKIGRPVPTDLMMGARHAGCL